jgi:hypothetical protein
MRPGFRGESRRRFSDAIPIALILPELLVIPLTLGLLRAHHVAIAITILIVSSCLAFIWALVSLGLRFRMLKELGVRGKARQRLFSGPPPEDPDELRAWKVGWQFMFAVVAVMVFILAIPIEAWLSGR